MPYMLILLSTTLQFPSLVEAAPRPGKLYIDKGACPFECCQYGQWTATKESVLYAKIKSKKIVATVKPDEKVEAINGEVHVVPLKIIAPKSIPDTGIKAGDVIYVLTHTGEGFYLVWHKGKFFDLDPPMQEGQYPASEWWIEIKTLEGKKGWTKESRNFGGNDSCA